MSQWPLFLLAGALGIVINPVDAKLLTSLVKCGHHRLNPGHVLTIRGSYDSCSWTFQGPADSEVEATCDVFDIRHSFQCQEAYIQVASTNTPSTRFCGKKDQWVIRRRDTNLNLTSHPTQIEPNNFTCDIYLRMPPGSTVNCSCGIENSASETRVVGGKTPSVGQYPWVGGLAYFSMKQVFCGVAVISDTHVLTAAHCVSGKKAEQLRVVVAEHNLFILKDTPRTTRKIKEIHIHPDYRQKHSNVADVAVLTLSHPLPLNHHQVRPVCLPSEDAPTYEGYNATVVGWGSVTTVPFTLPSILQAVEVPVWGNEECRNTGFGNLVQDHILCAGHPDGGADACAGDSGGPLTVKQDGRHVVVGTVSFGHSCALPNWPGIYMRTSVYVAWIRNIVSKGVVCSG